MIKKRGKRYSYRFMWKGKWIERSTGQGNAKVARELEAAHKTALAKGELGIIERQPAPTLKQFTEDFFLPHIRSTFANKPRTKENYEYGTKCLLGFEKLASAPLDAITAETIRAYVVSRQARANEVSTINRHLEVLRRMFRLAMKWKKVSAALETVEMLPGERRRDRVLTPLEETLYLAAARSLEMQRYRDPALLGDVYTILIDCGLRPEECFRLLPSQVRDGVIEIQYGKSEQARRRIQMTPRVKAIVEMRLEKSAGNRWIFPARTRSGHIEKSSLRKQHRTAFAVATRLLREQTGNRTLQFEKFDRYSLRHTCLTRWAPYMDPWALMRMAGHRDMATTMRYVHPEEETMRQAMERARDATERRAQEALKAARRALEEKTRDNFRDSTLFEPPSGEPEGSVN